MFLPALLAVLLWPVLSLSQQEFQSLLTEREITALLAVEDVVLGGLDGGGLLIWDADDLTNVTQLRSGQSLGGNIVSDLAYSGRYVWVATEEGGLTRIGDVGGNPSYRPYAGNLGGLDITAVAGTVIGNSERVYYAMDGSGLGLITDGLPGAIYTADQDGLLDNNINDLIFFEDVLYIATPSGVCRFADNTFTTINDGLSNVQVRTLALDPAGALVCGGAGGVFRWDPAAGSWNNLGWSQGQVTHLGSHGGALWGLSLLSGGDGRLGRYVAGSWEYPPVPDQKVTALYAGTTLWLGGRDSPAGMDASANGFAWLARWDGQDNWTVQIQDASLVYNACGVAVENDGTRWVGSFGGKAFSGIGDAGNHHFYELATVDNDSTGLFNHYANFLTMAADNAGVVYAAQYTAGIIRYDKNNDETALIHPGNSAMSGGHIVNMVVHPDGPLFMLHDWADEQKVQILLDPANWEDPANWLDVPQGGEGIGTGTGVFDVAVESRDVIWFMVEGTGLVRWDTNGLLRGPEDDLTWNDFQDDFWSGPMGDVAMSRNNLTQGMALDMAPDGSLWVGGDGVTRVTFDGNNQLILQDDYSTKIADYESGLINSAVRDLAVDRNGDLWVLNQAGLNRIAWDTDRPEIDAYFNLARYLSTPLYTQLYSTNTVTELPGGLYYRLVSSADRGILAMTASTGAVSWEVQQKAEANVGDLAGVYFYPQPFRPGRDSGLLKMAGVPADAANGDGARVEIYNLEGQLVYRNSHISEADGFWSGKNRRGLPVASGMYMLKLTWRNQVATRCLAVVR
ncbi:hypothetical protein CSB20_02545 [bacterium DOLZORAL124_64_63]|nr:MAG: hypothetical protein CSB20_02545 [bacterium DOLZORAL124_64_63]